MKYEELQKKIRKKLYNKYLNPSYTDKEIARMMNKTFGENFKNSKHNFEFVPGYATFLECKECGEIKLLKQKKRK